MKAERLKEIRERCEAATVSPWIARVSPDGSIADVEHGTLLDEVDEPQMVAECEIIGNNENDAEFIAHAREDIPFLLTEIERLSSQAPLQVSDEELARLRRIESRAQSSLEFLSRGVPATDAVELLKFILGEKGSQTK